MKFSARTRAASGVAPACPGSLQIPGNFSA
jgi:hypothetical protein